MDKPTSAEVARQRLGIGPIITGPHNPIIGRSNKDRRLRWRYNQTIKQLGGQPLLEPWR